MNERTITWFSGSPDAGDPACLCSLCGRQIEAQDAPAIRVFNSGTGQEARFHMACWIETQKPRSARK